MGTHHSSLWQSEDNLWESAFSFYNVGSGDGTQIIRLGGKHIHPLSRFYCPIDVFRALCSPLISFAFPRCTSCHPCFHTVDRPWHGLSWLGRVEDATGPWVLARREPDGFYYLAQIKAAPEASASPYSLLWVALLQKTKLWNTQREVGRAMW